MPEFTREHILELYHASRHPLTIGLTRDCRRRCISRFADLALESARPAICHSRLNSFFASAVPAEAWHYLVKELEKEPSAILNARLYRVSISDFQRRPMALVDAIEKRCDDVCVSHMAREYWTPTNMWKFWEYLGPQMTPLEEIDQPDSPSRGAALFKIGADHEVIERIWPPV